MNKKSFLVISCDRESSVLKMLFSRGFETVVVEGAARALRKIKNNTYPVVIVDTETCRMDILEFVLNVRDFNPAVPIVVVGESSDSEAEAEILRTQEHVFIFSDFRDSGLENFLRAASAQRPEARQTK